MALFEIDFRTRIFVDAFLPVVIKCCRDSLFFVLRVTEAAQCSIDVLIEVHILILGVIELFPGAMSLLLVRSFRKTRQFETAEITIKAILI